MPAPIDIRKLQVTGGGSVALTLPKRWIEAVGLSAGDHVGCIVRPDGTLLVLPKPTRTRAKQNLDIELGEESPEDLFRRLVAAYVNGYDVIRVRAKKPLTPTQRTMVRKAVDRAMGLEVVDEDPYSLTIQDFLDPTEFPLERGVRRMATIAQLMHKDAMRSLGDSSCRDVDMDSRDNEVDRLYWLVNKQYHAILRDALLADRLQLTPSQALNFLLVGRLVERTADHASRISQSVAELGDARLPPTLVKSLQKLSEESLDIFKEAIAAFFKRDAKAANAVIDRAHRVQGTKRALVHEAMELRGTTAMAVAYILESIERTASYGSDVAEIAINHCVAMTS